MNPDRTQPTVKEWVDRFADPEKVLLAGEANPWPAPVRMALWLELLLCRGWEKAARDFRNLPLKDQRELGGLLLRAYLFQPLYIRLPDGGRLSTPVSFSACGKFFKIEAHGAEGGAHTLLYPLDHRRLWPEGLRLLPEGLWAHPELGRSLNPDLFLASISRRPMLRQRAQTLHTLFLRTREGLFSSQDLFPSPAIAPPPEGPIPELPGSAHSADEGGNKTEEGPVPSPKKKKRKHLQTQLDLFQ